MATVLGSTGVGVRSCVCIQHTVPEYLPHARHCAKNRDRAGSIAGNMSAGNHHLCLLGSAGGKSSVCQLGQFYPQVREYPPHNISHTHTNTQAYILHTQIALVTASLEIGLPMRVCPQGMRQKQTEKKPKTFWVSFLEREEGSKTSKDSHPGRRCIQVVQRLDLGGCL